MAIRWQSDGNQMAIRWQSDGIQMAISGRGMHLVEQARRRLDVLQARLCEGLVEVLSGGCARLPADEGRLAERRVRQRLAVLGARRLRRREARATRGRLVSEEGGVRCTAPGCLSRGSLLRPQQRLPRRAIRGNQKQSEALSRGNSYPVEGEALLGGVQLACAV